MATLASPRPPATTSRRHGPLARLTRRWGNFSAQKPPTGTIGRHRAAELGLITPRGSTNDGESDKKAVETQRIVPTLDLRGVQFESNGEPSFQRSKLLELEVRASELAMRCQERGIRRASAMNSGIDEDEVLTLFPDPDVTTNAFEILCSTADALPYARKTLLSLYSVLNDSIFGDTGDGKAVLGRKPYFIHVQDLLADMGRAQVRIQAAEANLTKSMAENESLKAKLVRQHHLLEEAARAARARRSEMASSRREVAVLSTERAELEIQLDKSRNQYHDAVHEAGSLLDFRTKALEHAKALETLEAHHAKVLVQLGKTETDAGQRVKESMDEAAALRDELEQLQAVHEETVTEHEALVEIHAGCEAAIELAKTKAAEQGAQLPPWAQLRTLLPDVSFDGAMATPELGQWDAMISVLVDEIAVRRDEVQRLKHIMGYVRDSARTNEKEANLENSDKVKSFTPLGQGDDVPQCLRTRKKVSNKRVTKRDTEALVRSFWSAKKAHDRGKKSVSVFSDYMFTWLKERYRTVSSAVESAYNLVYSVDKYDYDADLDMFGAILRGDLPEGIYDDQMCVLQTLEDKFAGKDRSIHGRVTGKLAREPLMDVVRVFFKCKDSESVEQLEAALYADQPQRAVEYRRLFEENEEMDQGHFAECLRDQHLHEILDFLDDLERALREVARPDLDDVTFDDARRIFHKLDPVMPQVIVDGHVLRGFNVEFVENLRGDDRVLVQSFMTRVRKGLVKRVGPRPEGIVLPPARVDDHMKCIKGEDKVWAFFPHLRPALWRRMDAEEILANNPDAGVVPDDIEKAEDVFSRQWSSPARATRRKGLAPPRTLGRSPSRDRTPLKRSGLGGVIHPRLASIGRSSTQIDVKKTKPKERPLSGDMTKRTAAVDVGTHGEGEVISSWSRDSTPVKVDTQRSSLRHGTITSVNQSATTFLTQLPDSAYE